MLLWVMLITWAKQGREQEINVNYNSDRKLVDLELKNGYHLATILCFLWLPKGNGKGAVN